MYTDERVDTKKIFKSAVYVKWFRAALDWLEHILINSLSTVSISVAERFSALVVINYKTVNVAPTMVLVVKSSSSPVGVFFPDSLSIYYYLKYFLNKIWASV